MNNPQDDRLQSEVTSFRTESAEHDNYFLEVERIWSNSAKSAPLNSIDALRSAKHLESNLTSFSTDKNMGWRLFSKIAAVIALVISSIWFYHASSEEVFIVRSTNEGQIDTVALPDGSKVILSENSIVKYSEKFNRDQRDIYLVRGKAFFEIKKDTLHPFKVKLGESEVAVVGTSFNINLTTQQIDLDVKTGKVSFSPYKDGAMSILIKGQGLTYRIKEKQVFARLSQNSDSWLTRELVFVDTPLDEVCNQLSAYYEINIKLQENKGSNKKLNATFTNQTLENVLVLLNETYNIKIRKEKNQITLINP
ncbi:MAG: FecR family protein [Bacteroidia bacterium]